MLAERFSDVQLPKLNSKEGQNESTDVQCWYYEKRWNTRRECRMRIRNESFKKSNKQRGGSRGGYVGRV